MGSDSYGIDAGTHEKIAGEIKSVHEKGIEIALVVGGGNIFRGLHSSEYGMKRAPADHMGMLATVINALALGEALNNADLETRIMSAIDMNKIAEPFIRKRAIAHLRKGRIVVLGAGTGNLSTPHPRRTQQISPGRNGLFAASRRSARSSIDHTFRNARDKRYTLGNAKRTDG